LNLSGILVAAQPDDVDAIVAQLNELPGVSVHQRDDETGRVIVVQEAASVQREVEGLKRIKALPKVVFAELVYHYLADDDSGAALPPADLDSMTGIPDPALPKLNH
jgi:nitrate reductase NapD